jgi:cell division protease FtsH
MIDQELKKLSLEAYERAKGVIEEHRDALVRVAEALLEFEVLDGEEIAALVRGEEVTTLAARKRRPTAKKPLSTDTQPTPAKSGKDDLPGTTISPDPIKQPS